MDTLTLAVIAVQALVQSTVIPPPPPTRAGPVAMQRFAPLEAAVAAPQDSMFEYSAAYYRRLDVHRAASYAILPLFALQLAAGSQLYDKSFEAPSWAKIGHRVGATGVAALFVVNTVTGIPNLIEGRKDPERSPRKVFHALMMLTAEAGFTATGILADRAERSPEDRRTHRTVALSSMAIATIGYLTMLLPDDDE